MSVNVNTIDFIGEVVIQQDYVNRESRPIEAVYNFPVEEGAAVVDFRAEMDDGRIVETKVKEREEAKQDYDEAIEQNQTAILLEEVKPDIFVIRLGHLKPGSGVKITLKYITELEAEGGKVRLTIPTTVAPRYIPANDESEEAKEIAKIPYQLDSPAPLSINATVKTRGKILSIISPTHDVEVSDMAEQSEDELNQKQVSLMNAKTTDMDRDFNLLVESEDIHKPVVMVEDDTVFGTTAAMVSLVPSFNLKEQKVELIFLVDRSGSMGGGGIVQAKKSLLLFLQSLPPACKFNIFSFGSRYDSLFPTSQPYDDENLQKAKKTCSKNDCQLWRNRDIESSERNL